jgi:sulfate permease, SulP family
MAVQDRQRVRFRMLKGLLPLDRNRVPTDILAGATLAALAIPEVLGYTKISGTPLITGLYTILIPMTLYALFGSSRHLVVGADSATAAILASSIASMAAPRSEEWLALAGLLALMAGGFLLLARLVRLGFLADFLSRTVLVGFLSGVGVQIAVGELSGMLGLPGGGQGTVQKVLADLRQFGVLNRASLALSVGVVVIVVAARRLSRKIPGPLIAVVGAVAVSWRYDLEAFGVRLLGPLPHGLPKIGVPDLPVDWALIQRLVPAAFAMFVVILAQSAATSRAYAARYHEPFDEEVDLVGLALANLGAGLSGTFVVNGSPTKTQIVESAGARSQLSQLTTSLIVLAMLFFFTAPLAYLPAAVLSSLVFLIGVELVDIGEMRRIFRERPWEFWVALITAAVVVFVGVEQSILLAIVLSLAVHTRHGYRPKNMIVVPDDAQGWRLQPVCLPRQALPGLVIYRFMHNMYYANAQVLTEEVTGLAREANAPLHWLCLDLMAVNDVDYTAAEALRSIHQALAGEGGRVVFSGVVEEVRSEFDRSGLTELFGTDAFFPTLAAVVSAYRDREGGAETGGTA